MKYRLHLCTDKKLAPVIINQEPIQLVKRRNVFMQLCSSVMSQQLSVKVAAVIKQRFIELYGGRTPEPKEVLATSHERLRGIGLSNAKALYVKNIADFALTQGLDMRLLNKMENEEVIEYLTQIKGVGRWTVEMQLMFTLGREDVFAVDDLGIQTAITNIYKLKTDDKKKLKQKMLDISCKWAPYRTYACMHLWRYKDGF